MTADIQPLPGFLGDPAASAVLRATPEDFQVDEVLGFAPDGSGEHVLLHVRKRNTNTEWLARQLGRLAGVRSSDVSYCGMKDRQALTSQWFSVALGRRPDPDWSQIESADIRILEVARHRRKLRRGAHRGNAFVLTLRELRGDAPTLTRRLEQVRAEGVPNYFGEQRFGHAGQNLAQARALFAGAARMDRHQRGLYLSAARSFVFNQLLARRVAAGNWNRPLEGEILMLEGTHSFFLADPLTDELRQRVARQDLHPTGPLWGRGALASRGEAAALELAVQQECAELCAGLEQAGLEQERRSLRLLVRDFSWDMGEDTLQLRFVLPRGAYATAVVHELVAVTSNAQPPEAEP